MVDKNRNRHRKYKFMMQVALNAEQQETLFFVKKMRGVDSNAELIRLLLGEEKKRIQN